MRKSIKIVESLISSAPQEFKTVIIIIIIIITATIIILLWPRNTGLTSGGGHSHVLRAVEVLFSLGCQSSGDGVSIKIPVAV